jgi:hypothetical protein
MLSVDVHGFFMSRCCGESFNRFGKTRGQVVTAVSPPARLHLFHRWSGLNRSCELLMVIHPVALYSICRHDCAFAFAAALVTGQLGMPDKVIQVGFTWPSSR